MFKPIFKTQKFYVEIHYTTFITWRDLVSRPYLSQMGCMSSAKPRLLLVGANHVCSPYSPQYSSKSFVIIRISSLIKSHVSRQFSVLIGCKYIAIKRISSHVARNVSSPYLAQISGKSNEYTLIAQFVLFITWNEPMYAVL
jgi:hypothetical protein